MKELRSPLPTLMSSARFRQRCDIGHLLLRHATDIIKYSLTFLLFTVCLFHTIAQPWIESLPDQIDGEAVSVSKVGESRYDISVGTDFTFSYFNNADNNFNEGVYNLYLSKYMFDLDDEYEYYNLYNGSQPIKSLSSVKKNRQN